jgi:hypothetical protein
MADQEAEMLPVRVVQADDVGLDLAGQSARRYESDGGLEDGRRRHGFEGVEPSLEVFPRELDGRIPALNRPPRDLRQRLFASGCVLYEQRRPGERQLEEVVGIQDPHPQGVEAHRLEHVLSVPEPLLVVLVDEMLDLVREPDHPPLRVVDLDRVRRIGKRLDHFLKTWIGLRPRRPVGIFDGL